MAQASTALTASQYSLLQYLATVPGCDVSGYGDALDGRALEKLGLVTITKAVARVENAAGKMPYFGICLNQNGRDFLASAQPSGIRRSVAA